MINCESLAKSVKYILGLQTRTGKGYFYVITMYSRKKRRTVFYSFVVYI